MAYPPRKRRFRRALSGGKNALCRQPYGMPLLAGKGAPFPGPIPSLSDHHT